MFRNSSDSIEGNTTSATGFINKCINDIVPTMTIRTYPNQKQWITGNIRTELKDRAAAFKEQDSSRKLRRNPSIPPRFTIKQAKRQYGTNIESYYTGSTDARLLWQGLQTITDYKEKHGCELPSGTSLPDKLHYFYALFEASIEVTETVFEATETCMKA
jgi:hypothetical protein